MSLFEIQNLLDRSVSGVNLCDDNGYPGLLSAAWIKSKCVPLMKWGVDSTKSREIENLRGKTVVLQSIFGTRDSDEAILLRLIEELVQLEVLIDEILEVKKIHSDTSGAPSIVSMQTNLAAQHEISVLSLLSDLLTSDCRVVGLAEGAVDLLEYCMRKVLPIGKLHQETVAYLDRLATPSSTHEKIGAMLGDACETAETKLRFALLTFSVLRHLVVHREAAHVSMYRRLIDKYDIIPFLIRLVETRPWTRIDKDTNSRLKYSIQQCMWHPYTDDLSPPEASVWIMLVSLILTGDIEYNTQTVLSLRKYITPSLVDQLPPVSDLRQYLEELNLLQTMGHNHRPRSQKIPPFAIVEVHETLYEKVKREGVLHRIIPLSPEEIMECARAVVTVYNESLETSELAISTRSSLPAAGPVCIGCGVRGAHNRCSKCKKAAYCSRECQVKDWPIHRKTC